jgi:hypothetical protein
MAASASENFWISNRESRRGEIARWPLIRQHRRHHRRSLVGTVLPECGGLVARRLRSTLAASFEEFIRAALKEVPAASRPENGDKAKPRDPYEFIQENRLKSSCGSNACFC